MRLNKKGQVTPFIIVGIVIVIIAVFLIFVYRPEVPRPTIVSTAQIDPVRDYVEECIRNVGEDALDKVAEHGGFTKVSASDHFARYTDFAPEGKDEGLFGEKDKQYDVIFFNGRGPIIDQSYIEKEINNYVDEKIQTCLVSLDKFSNIEVGNERELKTTIGDYNTIITLDLPISFKEGNIEIKRFSYTFNKALGEFLNRAWDSAEMKGTNFDICNAIDKYSKCLCNRALDENKEVYILELKDANKNLADINYKFQFALI